MVRKFLAAATGMLWLIPCIVKVHAVSETEIIYIQEDGILSFVRMAATVCSYMWKDITAVCTAVICTTAMLILAIKQKKRGK